MLLVKERTFTFTKKKFPYSTSLDKKRLHPTFIIIQYTFHNNKKITAWISNAAKAACKMLVKLSIYPSDNIEFLSFQNWKVKESDESTIFLIDEKMEGLK